MIYKRFSNFSTFPKITFDKNKISNNLVAFLTESDFQDPPKPLKFLSTNSVIASDLKTLKSIFLYSNPVLENEYKRSLVFYDNIDESKEGYRKKFATLGIKATRTLLSNKIHDIDLLFSNKISEENFAVILNALLLTNYKYEKKTRLESLNGNGETYPVTGAITPGPNSHEIKKFHPISNVNLILEGPELQNYPNFLIETTKYSLMARDLVNERPNVATTSYMIKKANEIAMAHSNITIHTIVGEELKEQGLNLLYSVGKGSSEPPALVSLKYEGDPSNKENITALIGKGIVFDAGGLNIKPTGSIEDMFIDKAGACTVLSVLKGIAEMKLPINVVVTIALAENFLGNNCYRPSDIITSLKGLTVEIGNTDAEGRLVLADAMTWTQMQYKPHTMIELSTLTGACMVALGDEMGGLFSNNDILARNIQKLGDIVNEPFWRLPITDDHRETMKSTHADLNNAGKSKYGGASKAAAFLEYFVEKNVKWAHLDIAGPAESRSEKGLYSAGGTGFGVKLLLHYLRDKALTSQSSFIQHEN